MLKAAQILVRKASRFVLQIYRPRDSDQQWHFNLMEKIKDNTTGAYNFTIRTKTKNSGNTYILKSA